MLQVVRHCQPDGSCKASIPDCPDECKIGNVPKKCGEPCKDDGICDGEGWCVSVLENPCEVHGCEGKRCGEECLMGDIMGNCNKEGQCDFNLNPTACAKPQDCNEIRNWKESFPNFNAFCEACPAMCETIDTNPDNCVESFGYCCLGGKNCSPCCSVGDIMVGCTIIRESGGFREGRCV